MSLKTEGLHVFGPYRLDVRERRLLRHGVSVSLPPKAFDLLVILVTHAGHLVTKEDLLKEVWPGTFVEEANLSYTISVLRKGLGEESEQYIETVPKRGYRFRAVVQSQQVEVATGSTGTAQPHAADRSSRPRSHWKTVASVALATLALPAAFGIAWFWTRSPSADPVTSPVLTRLTSYEGLQTDPTFSPDGRWIAFASNHSGNFEIWIRPVTGGDAKQVTDHPAPDWQVDWSPNGDLLVFRSERDGGGLYVVPPTGGYEKRIASFGFRPRWAPDGARILFFGLDPLQLIPGLGGLFTVTPDGTPPVRIETSAMEPFPPSPAVGWHPDGRVSVLTYRPLQLVTLNTASGEVHKSAIDERVAQAFVDLPLYFEPHSLAWAPDRTAVYFAGISRELTSAWKVDVDPDTLAIVGGPHRLTAMAEGNTTVVVSRDGRRLLVDPVNTRAHIRTYQVDPSGRHLVGAPSRHTPLEATAWAPELNGDGTELLYHLEQTGDATHVHEIRSQSMMTGTETPRLLFEVPKRNALSGPRWFSDGTRFVYQHSSRQGIAAPMRSIRIFDVRSGRDEQFTSPGPDNEFAGGSSPDGRLVISASGRYKRGARAVALLPVSAAPHAESQARVVVESTESRIVDPEMSPNGRWIVFSARRDLERSSTIAVVATEGGDWVGLTGRSSWALKPRWSKDGRFVYFLATDGGIFNVWGREFDPVRGVAIGESFALTRFTGFGDQTPARIQDQISVSSKHLALAVQQLTGAIWMVENFERDSADR